MRLGTQTAPSTAAVDREPRQSIGRRPHFSGLLRLADEQPRRCFGLLFALFFTMLLAWGMGTPLQQAPDEWSHLYRAAQVYDGQFITPTQGPMNVVFGDRVRVPDWLVADRNAAKCFFHHASVPVSCAHPRPSTTKYVTSNSPAARYPPLYYAAVGWPLTFSHGNVALYLMRIVAAVLSSIFLAWGMLAALRLGTGLAGAGVLIAATPMVGWLTTMINPNGMEIAAAFTLWPSLVLWLTGRDQALRRAGAIGAGTAATVMLLSRSVSAVWVIVAVISVLPLLTGAWLREQIRSRVSLLATASVAVAAVLTLAWSNIAHQTQLMRSGRPGHATLMQYLHLETHGFLYRWWIEGIGDFGWLDTPLPYHYYALFQYALIALLVVALLGAFHSGARIALAAALAAGLTVSVTAVMAAAQANSLGIGFWQGRYSIPMGIGVPILLGYGARGFAARERWISAAVASFVALAATVIGIFSFRHFFNRNSVGLLRPFSLHGGWQPPGGITIWLVLLTLSMLGLSAVAVAAAFSRPVVEAPQQTEAVPALAH